MLPTPLAFAWMFWRRLPWGHLAAIGYLLVAVTLSAVLPAHLSLDVAPAAFALLTIPNIYLAFFPLGLFCLVEANAPIGGRHSCYPADLFLLPVRTGALAGWPMAYGAAAACLLWLVVASCIMQPWLSLWSISVPLWWPALLAMATLAWIQAVLWMPFGLRGLRVVVLLLLIAGLIAVGEYCAVRGVSEPMLVGVFAGLAVLGWVVGYLGVRQGRHGHAPDWEGVYEPLRWFVRRLPQRRRPFASAAWAQTWFEWKRTGYALPIMTAALLPFVLWSLAFGLNELIPPAQPVLSALAIPLLMASLAGAPLGGRNPWVKDTYAIGASTATLPMSIGEMVGAKLRAAALNTLATWAIVAVGVPLALILTGNLETALGWWRQARQEVPALEIVAGLLAGAILLVGCTWKRLIDSQLFGLTGRKWVIESAVSVGTLALVGLGLVGLWIFKHPQFHEPLWAVFPWLLGLLIACRLSVAGFALCACLRRQMLAPRTVVRWVTAWVCVALALFGLLIYAVPAERVPVYDLAFAVLFAMPMARLTAAPLALAWNRHR